MEDFNKISQLIILPDEELSIILPPSRKNDLLNFFLVLKTAQKLGKAPDVISECFKNFRKDIDASFTLVTLFFIRNCIKEQALNKVDQIPKQAPEASKHGSAPTSLRREPL